MLIFNFKSGTEPQLGVPSTVWLMELLCGSEILRAAFSHLDKSFYVWMLWPLQTTPTPSFFCCNSHPTQDYPLECWILNLPSEFSAFFSCQVRQQKEFCRKKWSFTPKSREQEREVVGKSGALCENWFSPFTPKKGSWFLWVQPLFAGLMSV